MASNSSGGSGSGDSQRGRQVGPYLLTKSLGKGDQAIVKLGVHATTGVEVAVKIFRKSRLPTSFEDRTQQERIQADLVSRVLSEVAVLRSLTHPHIAKTLDFLETAQHFFLVMEYVPGGNLLRYLRSGNFVDGIPVAHAFQIFYQLVSGLEHCHACGIAHRDIKLENILMDERTGMVKLSDFGLGNLIRSFELRQVSSSCGTPHYIAPELIRNHQSTLPTIMMEKHGDHFAADMWALGVVLFVMCSGRFPFHSPSVHELRQMICDGYYTIPAHFDPDLRDFVLKLLHPVDKLRLSMPDLKIHPWWVKNRIVHGTDHAAFAPTTSAIRLVSDHSAVIPRDTNGTTTLLDFPANSAFIHNHHADFLESRFSFVSPASTPPLTVANMRRHPVRDAPHANSHLPTPLSTASISSCTSAAAAGLTAQSPFIPLQSLLTHPNPNSSATSLFATSSPPLWATPPSPQAWGPVMSPVWVAQMLRAPIIASPTTMELMLMDLRRDFLSRRHNHNVQ